MNDKNDMQIFSNEKFGNIRTIIGEDGEPRFCLADVCKSLNLVTRAVAQRLTKDAVSKCPLLTAGGQQLMNFVNEDGLYDLILESRKPEAKAFRKWVTSEVLPSIRKHGAYMTNDVIERALTEPSFLIKLATQLQTERDLRKKAQSQVQAQAEHIDGLNAEIAEHRQLITDQQSTIERQIAEISKLEVDSKYLQLILASKSHVKTTQIAQDYGMSAIRFNKLLAEHRVHYKVNEQWILYMKYKDKGYAMGETILLDSGRTVIHTCWTQRGRMFLYLFLKEKGILPLMER